MNGTGGARRKGGRKEQKSVDGGWQKERELESKLGKEERKVG
jgi:hypothetical protein